MCYYYPYIVAGRLFLKINKCFSSEPRQCKLNLNLSINPESIPTLITLDKLNIITEKDENPYFVVEEILDITIPVKGVLFTREFWVSYLDKLKDSPFPGSKSGHTINWWETGDMDFYTIGGEIKENSVFLKIYVPPEGYKSSNETFIKNIKAGMVHFSIVSWTEDIIERDENGSITTIKAIRSVKGERNDAAERNMGAMEQKVNIDKKTNPYPNEHAARIRNPGDFEKDSFRRKNISNGVNIIIGKLKGKDTTTTQSYRFSIKVFTAKQAKDWLKKHNIDYISFEAATGGKSEKQEVYIMSDSTYNEIIENLKNQCANGTVSILKISKDLGFEILTDEQKTTLNQLKEVIGDNPIEKIKQLKQNEQTVKQQAYDNMREKEMSTVFGPEKLNIDGIETDNLKRQAAEPLISKNIQDEKQLKEEIEKAKENPVVKNMSFQQADFNSNINDITGIKIQKENSGYRKETIKA